MNNIIIIILLVVVALAAMIIIPRWRFKRAVPQVIRLFREQGALDIKHAKTVDELGLRSRGMLGGMLQGRDYRQHALNALMQAGIIQETEDDRLYLSEEELVNSGLERNAAYYR